MKKIVMFLLVFTFLGCKEEILLPEVKDGESTFVTLTEVLPNDEYVNGGVRIVVWKDNSLLGTQGVFDENIDTIVSSMVVENGSSGSGGGSGNGAIQSFDITQASETECENGGVKVSVVIKVDDETTTEEFTICNGLNGKDGLTCSSKRFTELFTNGIESADENKWTYSNFYDGTTNVVSGKESKFENTFIQTPKLEFSEVYEIVAVLFMDEFKYRAVIVYSDGSEEILETKTVRGGTHTWSGSWSNVDYVRIEVENKTPNTNAGISDVHINGWVCK